MDKEALIETALLTAPQPLDNQTLCNLFCPKVSLSELQILLMRLQERWTGRYLKLEELATGWHFEVDNQIASHIPHLYEERSPRYSRAVMETLAIIVYHQPVTRGDIEAIRGVNVSTQIINTLLDRGWIVSLGQKETPGRPTLWGTTPQLLNDLKIRSLNELPPLEQLLVLTE